MTWFDRLLGRKYFVLAGNDAVWGRQTKAAQLVNWQTALQVTTIFAICRAIADGVAQVPHRLRQSLATGGSKDASDHALFDILSRKPNEWQTAFEFWETITFHLLLVGNAFVFVSRTASGRLLELIPLDPGKVTVTRMPDLALRYKLTGDDGSVRDIPARDMWHLRGPSWNGWMGMEPVKLAREAIGLSLALEECHAMMHANGLQTSGAYSVEGTLKQEDHERLSKWIAKNGLNGAKGAPLILDKAAKWQQIQMTGVDAQHLETRKYQVEELCRPFRMMPVMIGHTDGGMSFASVEQMRQAHVTETLVPMFARIEQSAEVNLLTDAERKQGLFIKFYAQALVRGSFKERQEGLQIMRRSGVINADDWLNFEDMNPRNDPGGQQYIIEANMAIHDGSPLPAPRSTITVS